MAPKVQVAIDFFEAGGARANFTCPSDLEDAIAGTAGTSSALGRRFLPQSSHLLS